MHRSFLHNYISISGFHRNGRLNSFMVHLISLANSCPAIPLVLFQSRNLTKQTFSKLAYWFILVY